MNQVIADTVKLINRDLKCMVSIKASFDELATKFSNVVVLPVPGYIEISAYGPVAFKNVESILIDPIVITELGRLVNLKKRIKQSWLLKSLKLHVFII